MFIFISVFCLAGCGKDIYTDIDAAMKENGKFFSESFVTAYYDLEDIRIEDHDDCPIFNRSSDACFGVLSHDMAIDCSFETLC